MQKQYDVVIVGAGVAGAIFAWKLSVENSAQSILLIDAGENPLDETMRRRFVDTFALATDRGVLSPYRRLESNRFAPSPESGVDRKYYVQAGPDPFRPVQEQLRSHDWGQHVVVAWELPTVGAGGFPAEVVVRRWRGLAVHLRRDRTIFLRRGG